MDHHHKICLYSLIKTDHCKYKYSFGDDIENLTRYVCMDLLQAEYRFLRNQSTWTHYNFYGLESILEVYL